MPGFVVFGVSGTACGWATGPDKVRVDSGTGTSQGVLDFFSSLNSVLLKADAQKSGFIISLSREFPPLLYRLL